MRRAFLAAVLGFSLIGCGRSSDAVRYPVAPRTSYTGAGVAAGQPTNLASAYLYLPGETSRRLVKYSVVGGEAFREGDIALGPASTLLLRYGFPRYNSDPNRKSALPDARSVLWPNGEIPYELDSALGQKDKSDVAWAVEQLSTTPIRLRPRLPADKDYVVFTNEGDGCYSYLGRMGGRQEVHIGGCGKGGPLHEVLHAAGFEHEHNRKDRDAHITMYPDNAAMHCKHIFEVSDSAPSTAYDTASIMHYSSYACSAAGEPTMLKKADGKPIKDADALSTLDRAGIQSRYGSSNPVPVPVPIPIPGLANPSLPSTWQLPSWVPAPAAPPALPPGFLPPGFQLPGWAGS